jgi:L,D-transpeptidase YbiS
MAVIIRVSIKNQELSLFIDDKLDKLYSISTSLKGTGQLEKSYKTPLGSHIIRAMIGKNLPKFTIFEGRRATGKLWSKKVSIQKPNHDWILTRILWLSGTKLGVNRLGKVDTMRRYIYIHGTHDEFLLGTPVSHGCIRMSNESVVELFNLVSIGTTVEINEE